MSIKPILFNTEMVKAILKGRKTQTRRIIKPQPSSPRWNNIGWLGWDDGHGYRMKPPCEAGDILWVRETWCTPYAPDKYAYRADYGEYDVIPNPVGNVEVGANMFRWHPSIHMPKHAARIFLRVTDVWAERLHDMDSQDALDEGIKPAYEGTAISVIDRFGKLWNSTVKPADREDYGWEANPFVWVIKFELCEKPKGLWDT